MITVLCWIAVYIAAAVLVAAAYSRLRFLYDRRQIRRHCAQRLAQVQADLEKAKAHRHGSLTDDERTAFDELVARNYPAIPSQRTEDPS